MPAQDTCQKCSADLGYARARDHTFTLVGVYSAVLCVACRNDFHAYLTSHPATEESRKLKADCSAAELCYQGAGEEALEAAGQRLRELAERARLQSERLFKVAHEWCAEKAPQP